MSVDKLVDSTQLDSDLTSVANAIRAKSGGSGQLAFPSGFVSEIGNIPSGGGGAIHGIVSCNFNSNYAADGKIIANIPSLGSFTIDGQTASSTTLFSLDITSDRDVVYEGGGSANNKRYVSEINLHGGNLLLGSSSGAGYCLRYHPELTTVNAKCKVRTTNASNQFTGSTKLETIFWQENQQTIAVNISACPLTAESLVSLANGLSGTTTATLTLSSARKTMCASIMGTVSQVTDGGETYDFFTQSASGTVTLQDFITNTKGWTLA